jgi:hypothetical protein
MGVFGGLSGKQIDAFAKELADSVAKRYPPTLDRDKNRMVSVNRITRVLEDVFDKAADFHREHRLGVYKKARLGNSFKWELAELGYSEKFVEVATEGLVVYLTRKPKASGATETRG